MSTRMKQRRGTASQWISINAGDGPILDEGEIGFETDTGKFKIGDGVNHWIDLDYFLDESELNTSLGDYIPLNQKGEADGVATLDGAGKLTSSQLPSIDELTQDILDTSLIAGTGLDKDYNDVANTYTLNIDSTVATKTFAAELLTNASKTNITITGNANDGLTITAENGVADSTTDNLSEGSTNKYFTDERAQDAVGNILGTGLSYNDAGPGIGIDNAGLTNYLLEGVSGSSYGLIGTSTYLDVKNTNGYNKEIELDIAAVKTQLDTDGYLTTSSTSTLTNKTLTSPKINEDVALTSTATELNVLDGITSSTAELNILDGVTATASEINTLDGITASTSELNILDGATLTVTELNYVDGVTSGIQDQLDDKAPLASPTFTGTTTVDDIEIAGSLTFSGTGTEINYNELIIEDPLIYLAEGNTANINDLGFVASFNDGTYQHAGLVRDSSANTWKLFKGVTDEPTNTVNFSQGSLDNLSVGTLTGNVTGNVTGDVSGNAGTVTNGVYTSGSYSDPSWITGLSWSKISSTPTTLSGYGITDGLTSSTAASTYAPINSPTFTGTVSGITKSMVNLGNVENTALSTWAGSSNITTLGTVSTGTWSADTIAINKGGTGQTTAMAAATALLPSQTSNSGKYLTNDGAGTLSWATVSGYSAPTLGSTSIASGETVTTIAGLTLSSGTATTAFTLNGTAELRLADTDSTHYVGFKSPGTVSTNKIWTLPAEDGTTGQVLSTNGSGTLSWATAAAGGGGADEVLVLMGAYI